MRTLVVWGTVLLAVVLAGQLRIGVDGTYSDQGAAILARIGYARIQIWPVKAGKKQKKKKERPASEPAAQKQKKKLDLTAEEILEIVSELFPVILEAAKQFRRKLQIDVLRLELYSGAEDPADAAVRYGQASAVLGALWGPVVQTFHVVDGSARVIPDFTTGAMRLYGRLAMTLKLWQILWLGLYVGIRVLKALFLLKQGSNRRNEQRKAA